MTRTLLEKEIRKEIQMGSYYINVIYNFGIVIVTVHQWFSLFLFSNNPHHGSRNQRTRIRSINVAYISRSRAHCVSDNSFIRSPAITHTHHEKEKGKKEKQQLLYSVFIYNLFSAVHDSLARIFGIE